MVSSCASSFAWLDDVDMNEGSDGIDNLLRLLLEGCASTFCRQNVRPGRCKYKARLAQFSLLHWERGGGEGGQGGMESRNLSEGGEREEGANN